MATTESPDPAAAASFLCHERTRQRQRRRTIAFAQTRACGHRRPDDRFHILGARRLAIGLSRKDSPGRPSPAPSLWRQRRGPTSRRVDDRVRGVAIARAERGREQEQSRRAQADHAGSGGSESESVRREPSRRSAALVAHGCLLTKPLPASTAALAIPSVNAVGFSPKEPCGSTALGVSRPRTCLSTSWALARGPTLLRFVLCESGILLAADVAPTRRCCRSRRRRGALTAAWSALGFEDT